MIRALWLTSWYPNKLDKMNGDFIQRHALAVSLFCKVQVLHLEADKEKLLKQNVEINTYEFNHLTETILLYKQAKGLGFISKIISVWRYIYLFRKQAEKYIREHGIPDIVHVHVTMKAGLIALWLKYKYKVPYVITEHWTIYHNLSHDAFNKKNFLFKYFTKKILKNAEELFPVSNNLGAVIRATLVPVSFTVIPNAVNIDWFYYNKSPDTTLPFTFIHVSTLNYQKNPQAILTMYKQFNQLYPDTKLIMAGSISEELRSFISSENINLSSVTFTGLVGYQEIAALMQQSNAFLMFSRYENLPCVILEALCCGLPVISSNTGGIAEVINETNGILLEQYNEAALLQAMITLYKDYKYFHKERIAIDAQQKFGYGTIGKNINDRYLGITGKNSQYNFP